MKRAALQLSIILSLAATLFHSSQAAFTTIANFTERYSAVFEILDDPQYGSDAYMKVKLIYDNVPIQLEEMGGMWLGIGFGKKTMLGSDIVIC